MLIFEFVAELIVFSLLGALFSCFLCLIYRWHKKVSSMRHMTKGSHSTGTWQSPLVHQVAGVKRRTSSVCTVSTLMINPARSSDPSTVSTLMQRATTLQLPMTAEPIYNSATIRLWPHPHPLFATSLQVPWITSATYHVILPETVSVMNEFHVSRSDFLLW